jgi:FkbH-like protein
MNLDALSVEDILQKRRRLKRELSAGEGLQPLRIAVLGGSTTNEVVDLWELLLLSKGYLPTFNQSEYGQYYEEAVLNTQALVEFAPDLVYVHTGYKNVVNLPPVSATEEEFPGYVSAEVGRYRQIWDALSGAMKCQIVQNNFELPPYKALGNLDATAAGGASRFYLALNAEFAKEATTNKRLLLQDLHALAADVGGAHWFDWDRWFSYKVLYTVEANHAIARSLTSLVLAMYGRSKKVLVLDLDNTCWGGVIGDDGPDNIQIGRETPVAEAYTAFQEYCLGLRERGVLLAVCSKNNEDVARQGFEHPDSVLKLEHFSCFKANWEPKNILAIARELNLGVDSFVFADDNPAERAIVEGQIPGIAVPNIGSDVAHYPKILDAGRYFEPVALSAEDLERAALYARNSQRAASEAKYANYGEYLDSLEMEAEIAEFRPVYLERITQLTNKTNQFNLTTRRYTQAEMEEAAADPKSIGLYGRLVDRFGDNGLVSIVLGRQENDELVMDLWLMSCRVLKRDMEHAMLDEVVSRARDRGIKRIRGIYLPTKKNGMVADLYEKLGFTQVASDDTGATTWSLDVDGYSPQNQHIKTMEVVHG